MNSHPPQLNVLAHTPSRNTRAITAEVLHAARRGTEALTIRFARPLNADPEFLLSADALVLITTENFGYMSGAMKDFFDRSYYPLIDSKRGLPYALIVRAGKDGTGTVRAIESITKGLGWRQIQEPLVLRGAFNNTMPTQAAELAEAVAVGTEGRFF